jgi:hypothetical protein
VRQPARAHAAVRFHLCAIDSPLESIDRALAEATRP